MLAFYDFLANFGWVILLGFFWLVVFILLYFRTKEGKKHFDRIALKTPVLGEVLKKIYIMRFCENVSTLLSAGLSINSALKITEDTVNNVVFREIVSETQKGVTEGEKISSVFIRYPDRIAPFVIQMIRVGEETGKLDKTLMEIVRFYQKEVQSAIATFTTLLEPVMIILLGIVVALIAISVLEPLYGALGTI